MKGTTTHFENTRRITTFLGKPHMGLVDSYELKGFFMCRILYMQVHPYMPVPLTLFLCNARHPYVQRKLCLLQALEQVAPLIRDEPGPSGMTSSQAKL